MLKGHVQIELHNHKTGSKERIEQDNLVTNAVDMLTNFVIGKGASATDNIMPLMSRALGGLLVFEDPLTESASNVTFPHDNTLVAYAGQTLDTTEPERGSINFLESEKVENGYMTVWDFSTSQANGLISSFARTHYMVDNSLPFFSSAYNSALSGVGSCPVIGLDPANREFRYLYRTAVTNNWSLYKKEYALSDYMVYDEAAATTGEAVLIDDTVFTPSATPNNLFNDNGHYFSIKSISKNDTTPSDPFTTITLVEYDPSTLSLLHTYSLSIHSASAVSAYGSASLGFGSAISLSDGILFVPELGTNDFKYYIFDLSQGYTQSKDSNDVFIINNQESLAYNNVQTMAGINGTWIVVFRSTLGNYGSLFVIKDDGTYKKYSRSINMPGDTRAMIYKDIFNIGIGNNQYMRVYANYLGTICNLQTPFEKTSTTTMKVKYTLVNT